MVCLGGFELYSRWVPLLLALLAKHKLRSITKPGRQHEVFWASSETEKKKKRTTDSRGTKKAAMDQVNRLRAVSYFSFLKSNAVCIILLFHSQRVALPAK